jgi:hypothetical protein
VSLALDQRQLSQINAIHIQEIKSDQDDLSRFAFQLILQNGEVRGAVFGRNDDLAVDDAEPALMCHASSAIFQSLPLMPTAADFLR